MTGCGKDKVRQAARRTNEAAGTISGRHLAGAAAIALLVLAACAEETAPPRKANAHGNSASPAPPVQIEPLGGIAPGQAKLLAALIEQEAARRDFPLASGRNKTAAYTLSGAMDKGAASGETDGNARAAAPGTYVVTVLDIKNAQGARLHRIVSDAFLAQDHRTPLSEAELRRLAAKAGAMLADWRIRAAQAGPPASDIPVPLTADAAPDLAPDTHVAAGDLIVTGSLAPSLRFGRNSLTALPRLRFDIEFAMDGAMGGMQGPEPGAKLGERLGDALSRRTPTASWANGAYHVRGDIETTALGGGRSTVTIRWRVRAADGRLIGTVTQTRTADEALFNESWTALSISAAEAAADGVLALLDNAPRRG